MSLVFFPDLFKIEVSTSRFKENLYAIFVRSQKTNFKDAAFMRHREGSARRFIRREQSQGIFCETYLKAYIKKNASKRYGKSVDGS